MASYVKNKELREEIKLSREKDELTRKALDMLILMSRRFSYNFKYFYEEDREDCISFAVMDCYLYWRGYDPDKSQNAFAYYSQIIKNGFAKGWNTLYGKMTFGDKTSLNNIHSL